MDEEIKQLIKELYMFYAEHHVDQDDPEKAVCWGCFAFSTLDKATNTWSKLKHNDDCEVVKMKKRIKELLS